MKDEVKFIAVLKGEAKGTSFYEFGGNFDHLPETEEEAGWVMVKAGFSRDKYDVVRITRAEAEEFVIDYHPLV